MKKKSFSKGVYLMRLDFKKGTSEIVNSYERVPYGIAAREAFTQKNSLNKSGSPTEFYWVKFVDG